MRVLATGLLLLLTWVQENHCGTLPQDTATKHPPGSTDYDPDDYDPDTWPET